MNKTTRTHLIQLLLFVLTFIATTLSGAEWMYGKSLFYGAQTIGWQEFFGGMNFSVPFLLILTFHEFGHYCIASLTT